MCLPACAASCPTFTGYYFYQYFTGGSTAYAVATGITNLGQLASKCESLSYCVGFDTLGNIWTYLVYNTFAGAYGNYSSTTYNGAFCGGIYVSSTYGRWGFTVLRRNLCLLHLW